MDVFWGSNMFQRMVEFCHLTDAYSAGLVNKRSHKAVSQARQRGRADIRVQESSKSCKTIFINHSKSSTLHRVSSTVLINSHAREEDLKDEDFQWIADHINFCCVDFTDSRNNHLLRCPFVTRIFCNAREVQIAGLHGFREIPETILKGVAALPECRAETWHLSYLGLLVALSSTNLQRIKHLRGSLFTTSVWDFIENHHKFQYLSNVISAEDVDLQTLQSNGSYPDLLSRDDVARLSAAFSCPFWKKVKTFQFQNIIACVLWNGTVVLPPVERLVAVECWDDMWGSWREIHDRNGFTFHDMRLDFSLCHGHTKKMIINPCAPGSHSRIFDEERPLPVLKSCYFEFWEACFNSIAEDIVGRRGNLLEEIVLFDSCDTHPFVRELEARKRLRRHNRVEKAIKIVDRGAGFEGATPLVELLKRLLGQT